MSGTLRRVLVGALGSLLAGAGLVAATTSTATAASDPTLLRQQADIAWYGKSYQGHATASVIVPGIGRAQVVCSRDRTWIEIRPSTRDRETQMWSAVYQTKTADGSPYQSVAVKNARVYKYSNREDDGTGGTGATAREGFNQSTPIENSSSGYIRGVISQRASVNAGGGTVAVPPATSFYLTWDWSGYRGSVSKSRCNARAVFTTRLGSYGSEGTKAVKAADGSTVKLGGTRVKVGTRATRVTGPSANAAISWHGDADAVGRSSSTGDVNKVGAFTVVCDTGTEGVAQLVASPNYTSSTLWSQTITAEGDVDDHVVTQDHPYDAGSGTLEPIQLPENGMVRAIWTNGGRQVELMISSWMKRNDDDPKKNYCEVAIAVTPS